MKLLVLGGSDFVGLSIVKDGLRRGWDVTTLNRGRHPSPDGVTQLVGDRTRPDGLSAVVASQREWDIVVDTWSWAPSAVRDSARALRERAGRYVYISSCSVYRYPTPRGSDESAPLVDSSPDDDTFDDYARAKAGAERAVIAIFGERALVARPGLILGPYENIGRLPWWLHRAARGGQILAPGAPDAGIQYIDARDLAAWTLDAAQAGASGPVNTISRQAATTFGEFLTGCLRATGSDGTPRWTAPETILAAGVEPWTQLPIWLPPGELHDSMYDFNVSKAFATGLAIRPVTETINDTWAWLQSIGGVAPQRPDRPPVGLDPDLEARLLSA